MNKKHIAEGLDHKHLPLTTVKYLSGHRKHRFELVDKPTNNPTESLFITES